MEKSCKNCANQIFSQYQPPCLGCREQGVLLNWRPIPSLNDAAQQEPLGPTGFVRDARAGKGRMDLLPWIGIMEVSKLCEEGAEHYGERNIDKGAPLHSLLDSGARHIAKLMSGYTDEDHLRAACWNLLWALQERTTHPELNDTPWPWYGKEEKDEQK